MKEIGWYFLSKVTFSLSRFLPYQRFPTNKSKKEIYKIGSKYEQTKSVRAISPQYQANDNFTSIHSL